MFTIVGSSLVADISTINSPAGVSVDTTLATSRPG